MVSESEDRINRQIPDALAILQDRIQAVLALHSEDDDGCCQECGSWWSDQGMAGFFVKYPCPTVRGLTGT